MDIDWELLGEPEAKTDRTSHGSQYTTSTLPVHTHPTHSKLESPTPIPYRYILAEDQDYSDSINSEMEMATAHHSKLPPSRRKATKSESGGSSTHNYGGVSAGGSYLAFESELDRYHDFSGDDDEVSSNYDSHHCSIQEAIQRQLRRETEEVNKEAGGSKEVTVRDKVVFTASLPHATHTTTAASAMAGSGKKAFGLKLVGRKGSGSEHLAPLRVTPLRNIASSPVIDEQGKMRMCM